MHTTIVSKTCIQCSVEKPFSDFYKRSDAKDGLHNQCKPCIITNVSKARDKRRDQFREYARTVTNARYRQNNKKKYKVGYTTGNAIRAGKLVRGSCEVCGTDEHIEAHHCDYNKPLDVMWLCFTHHREWHRENEVIE